MPTVKAIRAGDDTAGAGGRVYYPLWFFEAEMTWKRLLMSPRIEQTWVCVDGVRGVAHRVDACPPFRELEVPEEDVLPLDLGEISALDKAESLARWWGRTRLFSWWAPAATFVDKILLHKVYVVDKDAAGLLLRDSVSGECISLKDRR